MIEFFLIALGIKLPPPPPILDYPVFTPEVVVEELVEEPIECRCVEAARTFLGLNVWGDAKYLKPNSRPTVGGGVLFDFNGVRHVAVIQILGGVRMKIAQYNKEPCEYTEEWIEYTDDNIVGYIKT